MDRTKEERDMIDLAPGQIWELESSKEVFRIEELEPTSGEGNVWRVSFLRRATLTRETSDPTSYLYDSTIKRRCNYLGGASVLPPSV